MASCIFAAGPPTEEAVSPSAPIEVSPSETVTSYRFASSETWTFHGSLPPWSQSYEVYDAVRLAPDWSDGFAASPTPPPGWTRPLWVLSIPRVVPLHQWSDTVTDTTTAGGATITVTSHRNGTISGWDSTGPDSALIVIVESVTAWSGTGNHRLGFRISGTGTESRTLRIGRGGRLLQLAATRVMDGTLYSDDLEDPLNFTVTRIDSVQPRLGNHD